MKTRTRIVCAALASAIVLMAAGVIGYQDWQLRGSAPGNPASGYLRLWADNTGGRFKCLTSGGAACYFDPAALTGDVTSTAGSLATTLATVNSGSGSCGDATHVCAVTTNGKGLVTSQTATAITGATIVHSFGTVFSGSALTAPQTSYITVPYACTIQAWNITATPAGSATIDIWKIATGSAVPTVTNTITASAVPAISSGTALHSTTLTSWTTSVSANDIVGFNLSAVATSTQVTIAVQCQ